MLQISLSKKLSVKKERGGKYDLMYTDGYISDGKFMVSVDCVKNRSDYVYNPDGKRDDGSFKRLIPDLYKCHKWSKTGFLFNCVGSICRVFKSSRGENFALIRDDHVKLFELEDIYGTGSEDFFCTFDQMVVVAPFRLPVFLEQLEEVFGGFLKEPQI